MTAQTFDQRVRQLTEADSDLARIVTQFGAPVYWSRPPTFASLVLFILEQQVSLASAAATYRGLESRLGAITPATIQTHPDLRTDGVSRQKQRYLLALADAVESGSLDLDALSQDPDQEVRDRLESLPGIGRWTSDVYLLACLGRPDIWPVGDRALQVGVAEALDMDLVPTGDALARIGERWRPQRSDAARIIWHGYLARRGRSEHEFDLGD